MSNIEQSSKTPVPSWLMLMYLIMIGFTFISMPRTGMTYIVSRLIQAIELLFFVAIAIQFAKKPQQRSQFNMSVNIWWGLYTALTYAFASGMGLTPLFKWLNIFIFLLLGSCYWKDNFQDNLKYIAIAFSILIYLNAILLIIYPHGIWIDTEWVGRGDAARYLFGNYNQIGLVCLLGITAQAMYSLSSGEGKKNLILLLIISIASVLKVGSMTSAVGLCILAIYICTYKVIKRPQVFFWIFAVLYVAFFVGIIWLGNSIDEIRLVSHFVEGVLSKDSSFSSRTDIWNNAVELIKESPIYGYGVQNVEWNDSHLGGSGTHNLWLLLLLQGGFILWFIFHFILIFVIVRAKKSHITHTTIGIVSLCILMLMSLFEAYNMVQVFLLMQFVYYSPTLNDPTQDSPKTKSTPLKIPQYMT